VVKADCDFERLVTGRRYPPASQRSLSTEVRAKSGEDAQCLLPGGITPLSPRASRRAIGLRHLNLQMIRVGASNGCIADVENRVGRKEGPYRDSSALYSRAGGKGAILATVNDIFAERDADTMRAAFSELLGIARCHLTPQKSPERSAAYATTSPTARPKNFGFDFLRDS